MDKFPVISDISLKQDPEEYKEMFISRAMFRVLV